MYLARCLRKPSPGLMDCMVSESGDVLHGPRVLEGDSQYIQQFQAIPPHANVSGRIEAESCFNDLRGQMRDAVRADFHKPGLLSKEHMQRALKQIDPSAACRGLPYATLLSDSQSITAFVFEMHSLAFKLGMIAKSWTVQDLYHARKPARNPQQFGPYHVLSLNPCQGRLQVSLSRTCGSTLGTFKRANVSPWWLLPLTSLWHLSENPYISHMARFILSKESFDSQWRVPILLNLAQHTSEPRVWCVADELLSQTFTIAVLPGTGQLGQSR